MLFGVAIIHWLVVNFRLQCCTTEWNNINRLFHTLTTLQTCYKSFGFSSILTNTSIVKHMAVIDYYRLCRVMSHKFTTFLFPIINLNPNCCLTTSLYMVWKNSMCMYAKSNISVGGAYFPTVYLQLSCVIYNYPRIRSK